MRTKRQYTKQLTSASAVNSTICAMNDSAGRNTSSTPIAAAAMPIHSMKKPGSISSVPISTSASSHQP